MTPHRSHRVPLLDSGVIGRCPHRVWLDARHPHSIPPPPEAIRRRTEDAAEHRAAVYDLLARSGRLAVVEPGPEAVRRTVELCRAGTDRIWGAVLPASDGRRGRADLLLRVGDGYIPVIVVAHRVTDPRGPRESAAPAVTSPLDEWDPGADAGRRVRRQPRDIHRLAQLTRLLADAGLATSGLVGGVIGLDADCVVVYRLGAAMGEYEARFAEARAFADGSTPTRASRIGECRVCPWWEGGGGVRGCRADLEKRRDVSLVAVGGQVEALRAEGVETVDDLAGGGVARPAGWPGGAFEDAVALARAWVEGREVVPRVRRPRIRRADIEIDVDLESYRELGAYLWGTLRTERGVSEYRPFVTWEPLPGEDEGRAFGEFWSWLRAERERAAARGRSVAVYCYGRTAEDRWLLASARRFAGMPGVPTEAEVRGFVASPEWVDVFEAVDRQFLLVGGKGLKKVAPLAGFRWRDAEAGGEASMGWYRQAVGWDPPAAGGAGAARGRILDYNEDDCRATLAVRAAISSGALGGNIRPPSAPLGG